MWPQFIVTGHGRSGTVWLARLLNRDPEINVHHEPTGGYDASSYHRIYSGDLDPARFLDEREPYLDALQEREPGKRYAEVNSYLRYCVPALRDKYPLSSIVAIIRDGRYVVRSMLSLGIYSRPGYPPIQPPESLDTFAATCWYWAETYRILLDQHVPIFRLEDLNRNYSLFLALCEALLVLPTYEQWQNFQHVLIHSRVGDPNPPDWGPANLAAFQRWAGEIQNQFY